LSFKSPINGNKEVFKAVHSTFGLSVPPEGRSTYSGWRMRKGSASILCTHTAHIMFGAMDSLSIPQFSLQSW